MTDAALSGHIHHNDSWSRHCRVTLSLWLQLYVARKASCCEGGSRPELCSDELDLPSPTQPRSTCNLAPYFDSAVCEHRRECLRTPRCSSWACAQRGKVSSVVPEGSGGAGSYQCRQLHAVHCASHKHQASSQETHCIEPSNSETTFTDTQHTSCFSVCWCPP